ncbi:TRAP transporter substrate-binding protein [Anaerobacillus sp. MEB173]|uniref:TRAP transporter substrate-binding protein n=1 Tax=Anaerobacillus sp. MEB173 TaxID=3383345 RepID=UPI003F90C9E6
MKMRKFIPGIMTILLFVFLLAACSSNNTSQTNEQSNSNNTSSENSDDPKVQLVLSHTSAPGTPIYLTYEKFKEEVEARSNGSISIQIHDSSKLAGDTKGVEMLLSGALDIASSGTNNMSPFTDLFLVFDLPYIFKNVEATHKVLSSEIGQEFKNNLEDELDLKLLFFADPGSQRDVMNSKKEVILPEDLKSLKFRSAPSPIEIATIEALGASATPIPWVEVYSSLEQGVVDGQLQQYHWAVTANHQEVIKYVTETGGIHAVHLALISKNSFENKLSENQKEIILEAAEEAQKFNFVKSIELNEELKQKMKDAGVQFYTPTEEELDIWMEHGMKVWDQFKDEVDQDLIKQIQDIQD